MKQRQEKQEPLPKISPDDLFSIIYTSGTTGNPKGAMISHRNMVSTLAGIDGMQPHFSPKDVFLSYLPLPHIYERSVFYYSALFGVAIGFYGGNILQIKDDINTLRPTYFTSAPRLYSKFYEKLSTGMKELGCCKKRLVEWGLNWKLENLEKHQKVTSFFWDTLLFSKIKKNFGGRIKFMISTSAPMSLPMMNFLKVVFCCNIIEVYGQTESTGIATTNKIEDTVGGNVGGPSNNTEIKIIDVPELNYTSEHIDPNGNLLPQGELCIRGSGIFKGYYQDPEKTKEVIDSEG